MAKVGFGMLGTHWRRSAGLRSVFGEGSGAGTGGGDGGVSDTGWFGNSVAATMLGDICGWDCECVQVPPRLGLGLANACVLLLDGIKIMAGCEGWRGVACQLPDSRGWLSHLCWCVWICGHCEWAGLLSGASGSSSFARLEGVGMAILVSGTGRAMGSAMARGGLVVCSGAFDI
jgi:hypothetical protein